LSIVWEEKCQELANLISEGIKKSESAPDIWLRLMEFAEKNELELGQSPLGTQGLLDKTGKFTGMENGILAVWVSLGDQIILTHDLGLTQLKNYFIDKKTGEITNSTETKRSLNIFPEDPEETPPEPGVK
jgi:hypothetical protein